LIHIVVVGPLVLAGGLAGLVHERLRRKRLAAQLVGQPNQGAVDGDAMGVEPVLRIDDPAPVRFSERAAYLALGVSASAAWLYPPLGVASLPILGYGAFYWVRGRIRSEKPWLTEPSNLLEVAAFLFSLGTGHWTLAALVLSVDPALRRWASKRTGAPTLQMRSALSRRGNSFRIALFVLTNVAVLLLLSLVLAVFGVAPANLVRLSLLALVFGMAGSFLSLALSKWIAKMSVRARVIKEASNDTERWLVETVAGLAQRAGIGTPEVAVYDARDMNAFATGMQRDRALIAVSTGLLARMSPDEVEAVLGHELAHVANGDMVTLALIQGVLDTFIIFLSRVMAGALGGFTRSGREEGSLGGFGYWVVVLVLQLTLGLIALMIVMWFARQREFRADAGGAELAGIDKMIGALERLRIESEQSPLPDRLAAFAIRARPSRLAKLFSSHPPLEDRIAELRANGARPLSPRVADNVLQMAP
jgi:heat shock protein HtpX